MEMVNIVEIVKIGWAAGVCGAYPNENRESGENSENDMGSWGGGVYNGWK